MRAFLTFLLTLLGAVMVAIAPANGALPPRPNGPVLDAAGIIPDAEEASLDAKLRAYNKDTGRAIIVATVPSLDDQPVDAYAQQLAEAWGIGGAETEQGVLFLVAPTERRIRIHTARGVQERLPDVLAGRIIRDTVTPRFKAKDMAGGIAAGVDAIIAQLNRDPAEAKAVAEAAAAAAAQRRSSSDGVNIGAVIFWIFLILFLIACSAGVGGAAIADIPMPGSSCGKQAILPPTSRPISPSTPCSVGAAAATVAEAILAGSAALAAAAAVSTAAAPRETGKPWPVPFT